MIHTNGLEEESVVVEIILYEQEITTARTPCPLDQDIQRSLPITESELLTRINKNRNLHLHPYPKRTTIVRPSRLAGTQLLE